ncbi:MAG: LptA/OstA family protein [Opitutales bacterium]
MSRKLYLILLLAACLASGPAARAADTPQTVIDSDKLDLVAGETTNSFVFEGNVNADGQGMLLTCERLEVLAARTASAKGTVGKMGAVESVVATGNVRIEQAGRVAVAGKAEVMPAEGLVILSDHPKIIDSRATVEGWKIIYNSKDRTVQVLPTPPELQTEGSKGGRSRVVLSEDAIPKLDYEKVLGNEPPPPPPEEPDPAPSTDAPEPDPAPSTNAPEAPADTQ